MIFIATRGSWPVVSPASPCLIARVLREPAEAESEQDAVFVVDDWAEVEVFVGQFAGAGHR